MRTGRAIECMLEQRSSEYQYLGVPVILAFGNPGTREYSVILAFGTPETRDQNLQSIQQLIFHVLGSAPPFQQSVLLALANTQSFQLLVLQVPAST